MPSLSPDGASVVFTSDREQTSRFLLRVMDLTSGATSTINVEGVTPVWSLHGDRIGFQELGIVGAVSPQGTGPGIREAQGSHPARRGGFPLDGTLLASCTFEDCQASTRGAFEDANQSLWSRA